MAVHEDGKVEANRATLLWHSFAYFVAALQDDHEHELLVEPHTEEWCDLFQHEPLLCLMAPRDHGKALDVATPIPTPTGWTTMGEIGVGDEVFDEAGRPTRVIAAKPIQNGRPCYRVTFDDGSSVVADGEHLWETWDAQARKSANRRGWPHDHGSHTPTPPATRTTEEVAATLVFGREHNHSIPMAGPLAVPPALLSIDPYVLGAWLGDGTSASASITILEPELAANIVARGCLLTSRSDGKTYGMVDHVARLRALELIGNKHIPPVYLRASEAQRRTLLAGLMDTDGHAATDGSVEYTTTVERLARDVAELAASLGFKPRTYQGRATLQGRDIGPKWRICWSPRVNVFGLARKAEVLAKHQSRGWRTKHRFVKAVEPVESVPVRCIVVDTPSHLFLAGPGMVPTHNSVCARCYMLWRAWRHNRDPETGALLDGNPEGRFEVVVFSETLDQATEWWEIAQSLMLGNPILFGDLTPDLRRSKSQLADVWSKRRMRLRNGFEAKIRSWRTSTRGLHPDLLILDDVLSDQNTLTAYQRAKSWTYFAGTLMPMNASEIKVIGTALHYDDLLHRLKPNPKKSPLVIANRPVRFRWLKYRSVNWDTGEVLWEGRHNLADLQGKRDWEPLLFSREYQNDPRDDASSLFPFALTQVALDAGKDLTFLPGYRKAANEFVVLGYDIAISAEIGADYTVCWVGAYDRVLQRGRILFGARERGLDFPAQLALLRRVCSAYGVDLGIIEENGFQKWLYAETLKYPETAGKLLGHRTGREKTSLAEGVPAMKLRLLQHFWAMPSGDEESLALARIWQSEMSAFGWKDGKMEGVGEHDDTVMGWWFLDRAIRQLEEWFAKAHDEETVTGEELGIARVAISADY